jgi:putative ABC transport system permease protein
MALSEYIENIKVAFSAIRMNLLRAILTIFIIAFGIMSLISMLTAVDGIKNALYSSFAQVGANSFTIKSEEGNTKFSKRGFVKKEAKGIDYKEAIGFAHRYRFTSQVSLFYDASGSAVVKYKSIKTSPKIKVIGTDQNYLASSGFVIEEGRNFNPMEVERGANYIIIGHKLKNDVFGEEDAIGRSLTLGSQKYNVIAYLQEKGSSFGGDQDNTVIIPLLSAKNVFPASGENYTISVQVPHIEQMEAAINEAIGIFRTERKLKLGETNDFTITKSDALQNIVNDNVFIITIIAIVIGIITLIGAAVGLTNIMLVSVTERTREIGIRKALGATNINIRNQFLWEAIVICQLGGLLGIILGIFLGNVVSNYFKGSFIIPWGWILLGVIICAVVGVISGLFPALKASRQNPIESLRYE